MRAHRLHDWAPPECGHCAAIWAACDSRGGDGGRAVTCGVIVYLPTGWCTISTFNERWLQVFPICCYSLAVTAGKWAFWRKALWRPHPARREVTCGDTDMDWPRPGAVLHTTGSWGRSYLGVGRRAASRAWQRALSKERHGFTVRETLPWKNTHMGLPEGNQAIRTPSPVQGLTGDLGELTPVLGLVSDCSAQSDCWGCWRNSTRFHTGRNWLNTETVESREGVRCRQARSSTDVCQRGAVRQRIGGGNTPCGVSPHPQGARLALRLVRQGDGIHYPVGQPLLGDSLPFLLTSVADKELLRASKAPGVVHVYAQCSYGTQQRQGWICRLRGQCLQVHHLIAEGRGGNLGYVSRPGSQDNVRAVRPEHNAWRSPALLMEVSAVRSAVLADRNFSSTESSGSKGPLWSPARTIERSQEGIRGDLGGFNLLAPLRNLTMRSCFPRDRPSTASWWAAIAATYTFKVEGDSLRSNLSCRKESTTPILHLWGVFSARRTPVREQTPLQCIGLPCWRSSSLSDGLYHSLW